MAVNGDVEKGESWGADSMKEALIRNEKIASYEENCARRNDGESIGMVLFSTFVAVCGSFEFGSCVGYSAPTQSSIRKDLDLSLPQGYSQKSYTQEATKPMLLDSTMLQFSMFGSVLTIGAMIGAITSGRIADFIGRKWAMRMSAFLCIAGWLAVYFAKGAVPLDIGRFLTGFGIGIFSYVIPVFIAELAPKNIRGGLATLNQLMIVTGSSVAFLIGTVVTWRTLALTGIIPCLVLLLGLFFIPESPRWLAKVGRQKEFEIALQRLRGKNTDVSFEAAEIQDYIESLNNSPKVQVLDLFQTKYIRSLIIGVGLMVFQQFGGINGISFYASQTFESAGASSGKIGTIAYACIQVPITLLGAVLMDKSGRRALLTVSASGTFLGCLLAGLSFFLKAHAMFLQWVPFLAIAGVLVYIGSFSIGMGATPWVIMSEIFPINVKGVAGSFVTLVNWIGAWVISYTFNFLMSWSSSGTFFLYSGVSLVTILFVAKFVPETKGRTLEEIQASINS